MKNRPGPIPYLGNKAPYVGSFGELLGNERVESFCDLTAGGCSVPLYFAERRGCRKMVLNDLSPYPRLLAAALFGEAYTVPRRLLNHIVFAAPKEGWASENLVGHFRDDTLNWIDGYLDRFSQPILKIALAACLTGGRFPTWMPDSKTITPRELGLRVTRKVKALHLRQQPQVAVDINAINYLGVPKHNLPKGTVVYLDPAWPGSPSRKVAPNRLLYGFYASTVMGLLEGREIAYPPEYDVSLDDFIVGIRKTITTMAPGNRFLLAYQATWDDIKWMESTVLDGFAFSCVHLTKNSSSSLIEFLYEVEVA